MLYLWLYRIVFGSFLHPWKDNFLGWRWRSGNNSWSSTSTKAITFGWGCADRCLLVIQTWQRSLTGQPIIHSEMYLVGNHCKITLIFYFIFFLPRMVVSRRTVHLLKFGKVNITTSIFWKENDEILISNLAPLRNTYVPICKKKFRNYWDLPIHLEMDLLSLNM